MKTLLAALAPKESQQLLLWMQVLQNAGRLPARWFAGFEGSLEDARLVALGFWDGLLLLFLPRLCFSAAFSLRSTGVPSGNPEKASTRERCTALPAGDVLGRLATVLVRENRVVLMIWMLLLVVCSPDALHARNVGRNSLAALSRGGNTKTSGESLCFVCPGIVSSFSPDISARRLSMVTWECIHRYAGAFRTYV